MNSPLTPIDRRLMRASAHVAEAGSPTQSNEQALAEALADLRFWARHQGVSWSLSSELGYTKYIHDRVNKPSPRGGAHN